MAVIPMKNGPSIAEGEFKEELLVEPYLYLGGITDKNTRTILSEAFNYWLSASKVDVRTINEATEMMYQACVLIDDIEMETESHNGKPAAHKVYGIPITLNCANYVFFQALAKVVGINQAIGPHIFTKHIQQIHRGQGMDIHWRKTNVCPTEDEYRDMILRKTGGLIGFTLRSMQLSSDNISDYTAIIDTLSLLLDIRDDYARIKAKLSDMSSNCKDFSEGRYSFPVIHGIKNSPDNEISFVIKQRTTDKDLQKFCVECLQRTGSLDYTRQVLVELESQLVFMIQQHGGNPVLMKLIESLKEVYVK